MTVGSSLRIFTQQKSFPRKTDHKTSVIFGWVEDKLSWFGDSTFYFVRQVMPLSKKQPIRG
jgi:hypothetical protein